MRGLPARVTRLWGGYFPTRIDDNGRLLTRFERGMALVVERGLRQRTGAMAIRTRALRRHLARARVQAVLAEYGPTGVGVAAGCAAARVPLVVHFHGFDAYSAWSLQNFGPDYPRLFRVAAAVIATSREMMERLVSFGAPRERLFVNPCGADTELFDGGAPRDAPPTFVAAGRFVDKKAPQLTLLAFHKVWQACPEARLTMVGDGPLWEACGNLVAGLGMGEVVDFPGVLPQAEVARRMRAARGFVQHSIRARSGDSEGTPVAILEAGATGLPVVSTRHAGIADAVVHGRTGFLVAEGDVEGMAEHWTRLATDADLAAGLGEAARVHVREHFSLQKSLDSLWAIIEGAIRRAS
jgi:glycosyltransferase involved in cell wall biosynthesis